MKPWILALGVALLSPLSVLHTNLAGRSFGDVLFGRAWGDVVIVTELTPEGRLQSLPTRENPVYFVGQSLGNRLGSIRGDHEPTKEEMNKFLTKILAKQNYLGAPGTGKEPTLFLVVQWGYIAPGTEDMLWFQGYDSRKDIGAPTFPGMLGPEVFRLNFRSRVVETILDNASNSTYGIIVTAFDHASAKTEKPVVFWQTRIALPANGKSMAEALPVMATLAGPAFGRETVDPLLSDSDEIRNGRVDFSDLEVLEVMSPSSSR